MELAVLVQVFDTLHRRLPARGPVLLVTGQSLLFVVNRCQRLLKLHLVVLEWGDGNNPRDEAIANTRLF